jgi:hypothetical protein
MSFLDRKQSVLVLVLVLMTPYDDTITLEFFLFERPSASWNNRSQAPQATLGNQTTLDPNHQ